MLIRDGGSDFGEALGEPAFGGAIIGAEAEAEAGGGWATDMSSEYSGDIS